MKYCLITSQYYHSYHMYIVKVEDNFLQKARACAIELMEYKRSSDYYKKDTIYLGDLDEKYENDELRSRYNINDAGDLYFELYKYATRCMREANNYRLRAYKDSRQYVKKEILNKIGEHHADNKIMEIIEKHFELA